MPAAAAQRIASRGTPLRTLRGALNARYALRGVRYALREAHSGAAGAVGFGLTRRAHEGHKHDSRSVRSVPRDDGGGYLWTG